LGVFALAFTSHRATTQACQVGFSKVLAALFIHFQGVAVMALAGAMVALAAPGNSYSP
jgi:hypothetical protein